MPELAIAVFHRMKRSAISHNSSELLQGHANAVKQLITRVSNLAERVAVILGLVKANADADAARPISPESHRCFIPLGPVRHSCAVSSRSSISGCARAAPYFLPALLEFRDLLRRGQNIL